MDAYFEEMLRRLRLTKPQRKDVITKYTQVSRLLHSKFYDAEYDGTTTLLIGSYGKRTNIRPPHDIDLLFKIPAETYDQYINHQGNGPSALLQCIRTILGDKYTTTEKISAWGKVVLVKFTDGTHDVELLPGFEIDGVFMIPNSEDGGSWESFDARADLEAVRVANTSTDGKARKLIKIIKRWRKQTASVNTKSYEIEQHCLEFLKIYDISYKSWSETVYDFFAWLSTHTNKDLSRIHTALAKAAKARQFEKDGEFVDACNVWRKVFGNRTFPTYKKHLSAIYELARNDISPIEDYIEDIYPVRIDPQHQLEVSATITGQGFRSHSLQTFLNMYSRLLKHLDIVFTVHNVPLNSQLFWKVRNFGEAARLANDLRGQIRPGLGLQRKESSKYLGTHYAECYAVVDGVCVARALQFIPIGNE